MLRFPKKANLVEREYENGTRRKSAPARLGARIPWFRYLERPDRLDFWDPPL